MCPYGLTHVSSWKIACVHMILTQVEHEVSKKKKPPREGYIRSTTTCGGMTHWMSPEFLERSRANVVVGSRGNSQVGTDEEDHSGDDSDDSDEDHEDETSEDDETSEEPRMFTSSSEEEFESPRRKTHPRSKPAGRAQREETRERWQLIRRKIPTAVTEAGINVGKDTEATKFFHMVFMCPHFAKHVST